MNDRDRHNIWFDRELWRQLKIAAAIKGVSVTAYLDQIIRRELGPKRGG